MSDPTPSGRISPYDYYGNYHGHKIKHLEIVHAALRGPDGLRPIIWLAGDSSLDNKHWILHRAKVPAVGGMERVLSPPESVRDVAHEIAAECVRRSLPFGVINTAIEESTLGERRGGRRLLPQDEFIRDHLRSDDVLIVSIGGNDVALKPSLATIAAMASLTFCSSRASVASGWACGSGHFKRMYTRDGAGYLQALMSRCSRLPGAPEPAAPGAPPPVPACVALCTIYFPDQDPESPSWAGAVLRLLGYDSAPAHLQEIIRAIHLHGTSCVTLTPPARFVPVPLFAALDGSEAADYVARVEPSVTGGTKMARLLLDAILPRPAASAAAAATATADAGLVTKAGSKSSAKTAVAPPALPLRHRAAAGQGEQGGAGAATDLPAAAGSAADSDP